MTAKIAVGEPLAPIDDALDGILRGFAIGGSLTLAVALLVGLLMAERFARPMRRMALIAARVDSRELSPRSHAHGRSDEAQILGPRWWRTLCKQEVAGLIPAGSMGAAPVHAGERRAQLHGRRLGLWRPATLAGG